MPVLTEKDFSKLASAAATDLVTLDIPLAKSIEKIASSHDMNDEQIHRLCEATNNEAFRQVFEAKGKIGSADRFVDFDVADAGKILRDRVGAHKTASHVAPVEAAADLLELLPLASTRKVAGMTMVAHEFDKVASAALSAFDDAPTSRQKVASDFRDRRKLEAAIEHLKIEKIAAEQQYGYALEGLRDQFRKLYQNVSFDDFEKQAMAEHGVPADAVLDDLRDFLSLPRVERQGHAKLAAFMVVDTKIVEHQLFKTALDHRTRIVHIEQVLGR